jgi:transcriptional regulator with XRE-family HTH domain
MFTNEGITAGFIVSLREAMGATQKEFGLKVGASKMTVSRWECGKMRPSAAMVTAIYRLQAQLRRKGVQIGGQKRVA